MAFWSLGGISYLLWTCFVLCPILHNAALFTLCSPFFPGGDVTCKNLSAFFHSSNSSLPASCLSSPSLRHCTKSEACAASPQIHPVINILDCFFFSPRKSNIKHNNNQNTFNLWNYNNYELMIDRRLLILWFRPVKVIHSEQCLWLIHEPVVFRVCTHWGTMVNNAQ